MQQEIMDKFDGLTNFVKECGFKRYPEEACGLIYSDKKGKPFYVECKNVSLDPKTRFLIDPNEQCAIAEKGEIVGCWHTHCDIPPNASDSDKQGCINTQVPWFIGSVFKEDGKMIFQGLELVKVEKGFEAPLIGRTYSFGVFDCFSLMRDYYKRELKIDLPDVPRREKMWDSEPDYMAHQAVKKFGFVKLGPNEEAHVGDLFFIQTGNEGADHIAIYVGDDRILHQMRNRLSRTDIYGGSYWQEHTVSHWRHKTLC